MRIPRTAAAALGTTALLVLAAPAAHAAAAAKAPEPARVTPAQAAPGERVTVHVACPSSTTKTVTASSKAFVGGALTLTAGPDGTYSGTVALLAATELTVSETETTTPASWGIDGKCPSGEPFTGTVAMKPLTEVAPDPQGSVETGVGGSVTAAGPRELATGGALVAAGIGGFWLLRRRSPQS